MERKNFIRSLGNTLLCVALVMVCVVCLCQAIQINKLEGNINELETQIGGIINNVESVRDEMTTGFKDQQKQIDTQSETISQTKQIVSTTNKAFIRFQNQQSQVEQELREELKKD